MTVEDSVDVGAIELVKVDAVLDELFIADGILEETELLDVAGMLRDGKSVEDPTGVMADEEVVTVSLLVVDSRIELMVDDRVLELVEVDAKLVVPIVLVSDVSIVVEVAISSS